MSSNHHEGATSAFTTADTDEEREADLARYRANEAAREARRQQRLNSRHVPSVAAATVIPAPTTTTTAALPRTGERSTTTPTINQVEGFSDPGDSCECRGLRGQCAEWKSDSATLRSICKARSIVLWIFGFIMLTFVITSICAGVFVVTKQQNSALVTECDNWVSFQDCKNAHWNLDSHKMCTARVELCDKRIQSSGTSLIGDSMHMAAEWLWRPFKLAGDLYLLMYGVDGITGHFKALPASFLGHIGLLTGIWYGIVLRNRGGQAPGDDHLRFTRRH